MEDTKKPAAVNTVEDLEAWRNTPEGKAALAKYAQKSREKEYVERTSEGGDLYELKQHIERAGRDKFMVAVACIRYDPLLKNIFATGIRGILRQIVMGPLPWRKAKKHSQVLDTDEVSFRYYVAETHGVSLSAENAADAISLACTWQLVDPVREYLDSLVWDGVKRLDTLGSDILGLDPGPECEILKRTMIGACRRVIDPGCAVDTMLVFRGEPELGKSAFVADLAVERRWRAEWRRGLDDKDSETAASRAWIVEFDELKTFKRSTANELKSFITRKESDLRTPYGRRLQDYEVAQIYVGCTNDSEFLIDQTGNRRFWIVDCKGEQYIPREHPGYPTRRERFLQNRDQYWAEALTLAKTDYPHREDREISEHQNAKRGEALILSDLDIAVMEEINDNDMVNGITATAVRDRVGAKNPRLLDGFSVRRIATIMRHRLKMEKRKVRIGSSTLWAWFKPEEAGTVGDDAG